MTFFKKTDQEMRDSKTFINNSEKSNKVGSILQRTGPGKRIPTGIPGFDNLIEGGFKYNSIVLVEGGAGTGKSIFSLQYIYNGITKFNENGIYISFEEEKKDFYDNMSRFGWDMEKLEKEKKFTYLRYQPEQVEKVLSSGGGIIRDAVDAINAKRIVIDSITAFTLLHEDELSKREAVLTLFRVVKKWGCTTLVIGQPQLLGDDEKHPFNILEFECDGVVRLYHKIEHNIRQRNLEVYKMRGTNHAEKMFTMEISENGIISYPDSNSM